MKKRQREKILKRAGIKLSKGFPLAGLSTLEMSVCRRKADSNVAIAVFKFENNLHQNKKAYGMDYLNEFMKIVKVASSPEKVTNVKGSDSYARV